MNAQIAWYLCLIIVQSHAFTHWVVTENGRIEPKLDTHFYLRRPYDLIALLDQEKRRNELDALVEEMTQQRNLIDHKSLQTSYIYNQDCAKVPKDIPNGIAASNASDRVYYTLQQPEPHVKVEAMCTRFYYLPFSMKAFEHLESMQMRKESKEETCEDCLPDMNWEAVGPTIVVGLEGNSTSWLHYNLGILYWWRLGNLFEAVECARRALHFAPKEFYDIPLANLGNLLYLHGGKFEDALTVIKAAINHAPHESKYYLLLGKAYIHKGEYESGVKCFEKFKSLARKNDDEHLEDSESMSCILKALIGMKEYQDMLQGILTDLHDFHTKQQKWLSLQERFLWEIAPNEFKITLALSEQLTASSHNLHTYKGFKNNIEKVLETYKDKFNKHELSVSLLPNTKTSTSTSSVENENEEAFERRLASKYPMSLVLPDNLYFDSSKWPTKEQCLEWKLPLTESEDLNLPVFLPLENKGYDVKTFLTQDINLEETTDHPLPWYPPLCEVSEFDIFGKFLSEDLKVTIEKNKPLPTNNIFRAQFLNYINNGNSNEAEIGQRIVTAMQKKLAPMWTLAMLANTYWRIRGNTKNAIHCLEMYVEPMPPDASDVPFISMASMLYQMGLMDNALKFTNLAARVNYNEPSTNFLLALIHYKKHNPIKAMFYLKNVLRVEPGYYEGEAERLLKLWSCRIKLGEYELKREEHEEKRNMCTGTENAEGVVCSPNGEQCKTAAIQCFKTETVKNKIASKPLQQQQQRDVKQCASGLAPGSLISSMMHSESAKDAQDFHMRIFFGDENEVLGETSTPESSLGDFYVSVDMSDDSVHEVTLNVFDKSGTYTLSKSKCQDIKDADWLQFTSMWETFSKRQIDISSFLTENHPVETETKPHCTNPVSLGLGPSAFTLEQITSNVLKPKRRLPTIPEECIAEWLGLMAADQESKVSELAAKIGTAIKENNTSWILATAAALYWRVIGNTEEAVMCIRQALAYVPSEMKDIPLLSLANILQKIGHYTDALEVIEIALESNPKFVVNHFTAGNIYTSLGDYEKAVALYRSSLALDANFEPARNRLQAILCTLLFDESRTIRETTDTG